ncbi:hypothetical protein LCGC14_0319800 [marine sediment metagenome]|uniref:Uncharacterized protein n=1 Tax=marine sediment metagenome TaxID=412755 RepID=A0A0F9U250_9ZZZZ
MSHPKIGDMISFSFAVRICLDSSAASATDSGTIQPQERRFMMWRATLRKVEGLMYPSTVELIGYESPAVSSTTVRIRYRVGFLWWKRSVEQTLTRGDDDRWYDDRGRVSKFNDGGLDQLLGQITMDNDSMEYALLTTKK